MTNFEEALEIAADVEVMLGDVSMPLRTSVTCKDYASLVGCLKQAETEAEMLVSQIRWAIKTIKNLESDPAERREDAS